LNQALPNSMDVRVSKMYASAVAVSG